MTDQSIEDASLEQMNVAYLKWKDTDEARACNNIASITNGIAEDNFKAGWQAARQSSQSEPVAYKCFHCSESFTDEAKAAEHFGVSEMQEPACQIDITKYREMERYVAMAREEDTETDRAMHALKSQHQTELQREEEKGYARGLRDANYLAAPQQAIPSGYAEDKKDAERYRWLKAQHESGPNPLSVTDISGLLIEELAELPHDKLDLDGAIDVLSASPTAPIERDK
jgi:hypothetical protein